MNLDQERSVKVLSPVRYAIEAYLVTLPRSNKRLLLSAARFAGYSRSVTRGVSTGLRLVAPVG